jgi:hypothetical protein
MTDAANTRLAELLRHPRYEVIPLDGMEEAVLEHVPREVNDVAATEAWRRDRLDKLNDRLGGGR